MTFNPSEKGPNTPEEAYESVREQAAFLQEASEVMHLLPTLKQPVSDSHIFDFIVLPSTDYAFPAALDSLKYKIEAISVAVGDAHRAESDKDTSVSSFLSVEFIVGEITYTVSATGDETTDAYILTRFDGAGYAHSESGRTFNDRLEEVGTLTHRELNAFLMSIAMPNTMHDYEAYADKNLLSAEAYESMIELLAKRSMERIDNYHFMLDDEETDVHFTKESDQTISFDIIYYDDRKNMPVCIEYQSGTQFTLAFFMLDGEKKLPFAPTGEEINRARQILLKQLKVVTAESFPTNHGEVIEPESAPTGSEHALDNEITGHVDDLLNELGLNPPNTGA